jgi:hypothetical protein
MQCDQPLTPAPCSLQLALAAVFVTASLVNSMLRKWRESFDEKLRQLRLLQDRMAASTSYAEWREFAQQVRQPIIVSSC